MEVVKEGQKIRRTIVLPICEDPNVRQLDWLEKGGMLNKEGNSGLSEGEKIRDNVAKKSRSCHQETHR